jgi:hypothetical protein
VELTRRASLSLLCDGGLELGGGGAFRGWAPAVGPYLRCLLWLSRIRASTPARGKTPGTLPTPSLIL